MKELIFINLDTNIEFMINVNNDLKIIDCYTFIDDIKEEKEKDVYDYDFLYLKYKVGKNPLFGHNKKSYKTIIKDCVYLPENENEWNLAHKIMEANDIIVFEIIEP